VAVEYPEHEKLAKVKDLSQQLGAFIEWAEGQGIVFAKWGKDEDDEDQLFPEHRPINQWLADFYDVDLNKIDDEKRQMLEEIRANAART
jgi:hypothetical protein